jgi:hypothetical protein
MRCDYGSRRLDKTELAALIDLCEQNYYSQQKDSLPDLKQLGRRLYQWLDGNEAWLIGTNSAGCFGIGRTKVSRVVECVSSARDGGYCQGYFFDFSP